MEELKSTLARIEAEITKKPQVSPWVVSVLVPLIVAGLTSLISIYAVTKTLTSGDRANTLKQVEILNTVIKDFSPEYPERTVALLDVVQAFLPMEEAVLVKLRNYAASQTTKKVDAALLKGGPAGAAQVAEVLKTVAGSEANAAKQITTSITTRRFHVVVASGTTKELANKFRSQLLKAGFAKSVVIETSNRFAVSLGEFPFDEAALQRDAFLGMGRFHPTYPNAAYLETAKAWWKVGA